MNSSFIMHQFEPIEQQCFEEQNGEYGGMLIKSKGIEYRIRIGKKTAKKVGQFITIWEKDENGKNTAYAYNDFPEYLVVFCQQADFLGKFVFPKNVLLEKGVLKTETEKGKMALRIYPRWEVPTSKQAQKTQNWQLVYFEMLE